MDYSSLLLNRIAKSYLLSPLGDCVIMKELMNTVILNLFQDLMNSANYEIPK